MLADKPMTLYIRTPETRLASLTPLMRLYWGSLLDPLLQLYDDRHGRGCKECLHSSMRRGGTHPCPSTLLLNGCRTGDHPQSHCPGPQPAGACLRPPQRAHRDQQHGYADLFQTKRDSNRRIPPETRRLQIRLRPLGNHQRACLRRREPVRAGCAAFAPG